MAFSYGEYKCSLFNLRVRKMSSKLTMNKLDKYRAFRHFFSKVYGYNLDSDRIKELLLELPETVDIFTEDVRAFMNLLDLYKPT